MYSPEELNQVNAVFVRISKDSSLSLNHGLVMRDRMWSKLEKGITPTGYRYDWLLVTAKAVIRLLGKEAEHFDSLHQGDRVSVEDLKDALAFALDLLEGNSKAKPS